MFNFLTVFACGTYFLCAGFAAHLPSCIPVTRVGYHSYFCSVRCQPISGIVRLLDGGTVRTEPSLAQCIDIVACRAHGSHAQFLCTGGFAISGWFRQRISSASTTVESLTRRFRHVLSMSHSIPPKVVIAPDDVSCATTPDNNLATPGNVELPNFCANLILQPSNPKIIWQSFHC